ncbi:hypothetical protein C3K47_15230 [Solitalea longa]|uniref:Uncharacterized protein n=1 Tax=Solitalea longa TaxID=2079460 RepID=A0A2S4ZZL7_9SPHI|nr:DUF3352 domain-containing protein [Solitalea longa]POY35412.1 hypothetical protein C3K47_15230 [Solitalea longa]
MNKFLAAVIVLVVAVVTIVFFYFRSLNSSLAQSQPLKAIPASAALVVDLQHSNEFFTLVKKSKLLENLFTAQQLNKLNDLNKSFLQHADLNQVLNDQRILISSHVDSSGKAGMLFIIPIEDNLSDKFFEHLIDEENKGRYSASKFSDITIYTMQTTNNEPFVFCRYNGLLVGSFDKHLLEQSLDLQLHQEGKALENLIKVDNNQTRAVQASLYINYSNLSSFIDIFLPQPNKETFSFLTEIAKSSNLNLNYKSDALMFNGITEASLTNSEYLAMFLNQKPQIVKIPRVVSAKTAVLIDFGIDNYGQFKKDQKVYLGQKKQMASYEKWLGEFNKAYKADFENDWASFMGNEFALAIYENSGARASEEQLAIIALKDTSKAIEYFQKIIEKGSKRDQLSNRTTQYKGFSVIYLNYPDVLTNALGPIFKEIKRPYMAIVDKYLIAAISQSSLQNFIDEYLQVNPLQSDKDYQSFANYINEQSNIYIYLNRANSQNMLAGGINKEFTDFVKGANGFSNYYGLTFQLNSSEGEFFSNLNLLYLPHSEKPKETIDSASYQIATTFNLDADLLKQPLNLKLEKGDDAFVLVDKQNQMYLVNEAGRLLWKLKLDNPLLGNVNVKERDGKPILIFNTSSKLYACDENAKPLPGFPIVFKKKCTAPVSVFDYEGTQDYRIFTCFNNKSVYVFDLSAKAVEGWNPKQNAGYIEKGFQMAKVAGITFLFTVTKDNKFCFYDRKGKTLTNGKLPNKVNNDFYPVTNRSATDSKFVSTDTAGNIVTIFFDGRLRSKSLGTWSEKHLFAMRNIVGDQKPEYVFFDKNHLFVYSTDGSLIYDYEPEVGQVSPKIQFFEQTPDKYSIGVHLPETSQLIELTEKGELVSGFPINGNSLFTVYNSKLYKNATVITGTSNKKVIIYKK